MNTSGSQPAYRALALQSHCHAVNGHGEAEARAMIRTAIARIDRQIAASLAFLGPDVRLVVLPEYVLTGFPAGEPVDAWARQAALAPDGPEYESLAAVAAAHGVYLAVSAYETDPHFPGLYFQASTVHSPGGECVLRYRRLHSLYSPTPYDVWEKYLDVHGADAVLPVARTPIGALAAIASEEILYPELARALALRGAEVFVHSSAEAGSPRATPKDVAKVARAVENMAYVVSANTGGHSGAGVPSASTDGLSKIVGFTGQVLAEAGPGESMVANAEIDLLALRRHRTRPGMGNLLARVKTGLWAEEYARHDVERTHDLNGRIPERSYFAERHAEALARLRSAEVIG
ncbi:nitrilase-related carbon-nitrogen hydrolase [Yinghuangia sp. YIM S09857]|uniref:nitrilase-related carbon-nitrogen hydrolase n=1 Tax=Yinghuangia sp. YIM S09857 TaxID=3436929 RepID=UPI003F535F56